MGSQTRSEGVQVTDQLKGFVVTLEKNLREDDAQATITAINQLRGVLTVELVGTDLINDLIIESRVRSEIATGLFNVLYPKGT